MPKLKKIKSSLKLYNTLTRKKELFKPIKPGEAKIFTCGPSIYQRPHIGNYRTFMYEDVLIRYLEFLGYKIERVLVFTDIEDKSVAAAKEQGIKVKELTDGIAKKFFGDSKLLRLKPPTYNPRSSTTVDQATKIIRVLLKKGIAYEYKGDIYYDPLKFKGFGKLFRLDMSKWPAKKRRFKKDTYPGIQWNYGDFILWRGCEPEEDACFDDVLGFGRPSWNVQDPAMAIKYLGEQIDIHCGGIDNLWRHHDYNLAIAEGVTGKKFSNYWLHGGHLFVDGKKMSKSRGNIICTEHIIDRGYAPHHLRFFLMYGPYREKMNFTEKKFKQVSKRLDSFRDMVNQLKKPVYGKIESANRVCENIGKLSEKFQQAMNNDLDVKSAFDDVFDLLTSLLEYKNNRKLSDTDRKKIIAELEQIDQVLKVIF